MSSLISPVVPMSNLVSVIFAARTVSWGDIKHATTNLESVSGKKEGSISLIKLSHERRNK
jgi:hypothetical protein